jgi:eukaryotic-like serine/threonine-protein kinase
MNVKRYNRIDQIVQAAVELPEQERAAYLESACGEDTELHREVESVIEYQEKAGSFLETPAIEDAAGMLSLAEHQSLIGREIGRYKIISKIGQGGMGEVYLARDSDLERPGCP